MSNTNSLILASSSPRRKELLELCDLEFQIMPADISEDQLPGETPEDLVRRLAYEKADRIAQQQRSSWIIGADTIVTLEGEVFGKPKDEEDAYRMLSRLQGRLHTVWGGLSVLHHERKIKEVHAYSTDVTMAPISEKAIRDYVSTGEPMGKAGSYAVQGRAIRFIEEIQGSYSNVVGLHVSALIGLLRKVKCIADG